MKKIIYAVIAFSPVLASAAVDLTNVSALVTSIGTLLNKIIPVIFAVGLIYFFWGLVQYIRAAGDPKQIEAARNHMIWGIIALAVMVSVYGLINWLTDTAGLNNTTKPTLPGIPTSQS